MADQVRLGADTHKHTHTHTYTHTPARARALQNLFSKLHVRAKGYELLRAHTHMWCSIGHLRVVPKGQRLRRFGRPSAAASIRMWFAEIEAAPRGRNFVKASPTSCCCENTHVCCRLSRLRVAPKGQALQGFARPIDEASIHMCAAKSIKSGLHPRVEMLQRSGRPGASASIHMCAAE